MSKSFDRCRQDVLLDKKCQKLKIGLSPQLSEAWRVQFFPEVPQDWLAGGCPEGDGDLSPRPDFLEEFGSL